MKVLFQYQVDNTLLKYSILSKLQQCHKDPGAFNNACKVLAFALKITDKSLKEWLTITKEDSREIPLSKMEIISQYLKTTVAELQNFPTSKVDFEAIEDVLN